MGRDKKNEKRVEHFARLERRVMETPAWRSLPHRAQALFPWLLLEWRGPNANNNGKIRLSVRQAAAKMNCCINVAAKAFHDLQAKGFIVVTEYARLGISGHAKGPTYEITTIQLPNDRARSGRRLFEKWRPGADFEVHKARANNPNGLNGRANSLLQNTDCNVVNLKT